MATEYIVLDGQWNDNGGGRLSVVVRTDVPSAGANDAGVPWQTAVAQYRATTERAGTTLWPGGSIVDLDDGSRVETEIGYRTSVDRPGLISELEAAITDGIAVYVDDLQDRLRYWGKEGSV